MATVLTQIDVLGRQWDIHAMIGGALMFIVGAQVVGLGLCAHTYGTYFMGEKDDWFDRARSRFHLNQALLVGGIVFAVGFALGGLPRRSPGSTAASASSTRSGSRCWRRP